MRLGEQEVPALSVEDELLLISIHGAKHFWERLLWIADVAALITHEPIDWDRAATIAREVDAQRMLRLALLLAKDVAGATLPAPIQIDAESDAGALHMARQIAARLPHADNQPMSLAEPRFLPRQNARRRIPGTHIPVAAVAFTDRGRLARAIPKVKNKASSARSKGPSVSPESTGAAKNKIEKHGA